MSQALKMWSEFSVTKENNDIKLCIVEAPRERLNDVAELIFNYFAPEEISLRAAGIHTNEAAMEEFKVVFRELLNDEALISLMCCLDNGNDEIGEIVGVSLMSMKSGDSDKSGGHELQTEQLRTWFKLKADVLGKYDVKAKQGVDKYYHGVLVVVHPDYRRLGIAQKLYEVRRLVSKRDGVPLLLAITTSPGSQKAAENDGWKTVYEFNSEEYAKKYGLTFDSTAVPMKMMIVIV